MHPHPLLAPALAALLASTALAAHAEGAAKTKTGLPGVNAGHAIVSPAPPPPEDAVEGRGNAEGRGTTFRMGDFDVTVTGSISVELGFGRRPVGGRR
jgi:hypothetical protein